MSNHTETLENVRPAPPRRRRSRLRRMFSRTVLVVLVGGTIAYFFFTDDERVRGYAEQWLHEYSGGEVHIAHAHLDLFHGLTVSGVTVAVPEAARFDVRDNSLSGRTIFRAGGLFLRLRLFNYFAGESVVPEIIANDPELVLLRRLSDGAQNWEALDRAPAKKKKPSAKSKQLPIVRFHNLRIVQQRVEDTGRSEAAVMALWGEAQPAAGQPEVYDLTFARLYEPAAAGPVVREEGRLSVNLRTYAVSGDVPSLSLDDLAAAIPANVLSKLDRLGLEGSVRAESVKYDPNGGREGTIILRDVSLSVPIEEAEEYLGPEGRFIQLSKLGGEVRLHGDEATVELHGLLRDSPLTLKGTLKLDADATGFDDIGFDASIDLNHVLLPLMDDDRPAAERRFAQRWFKLREFVKDYDPRGRADFKLHFGKAPGKGNAMRFVDGELIARGASARYFRFPYRLYDLSGSIYFRPDGRIEIREFTGVHARGRTVINGLVDGYVSQGLDVNIKTESIDLDDDLTRCLEERDRRLIRLFNTQALMNLDVKLHREPKPHGLTLAQNPWKASVDVEFLEGAVKYEGLPYPLSGLNGKMHIERGGFTIDRMRASRGAVQVELSGQVRHGPDVPREMDLKLNARDVPLDNILREALDGEARAMYDRIDPRGVMQITGRIRNARGADDAVYDLEVALDQGALNLPETKVRLSDAHGQLRIAPRKFVIDKLDGRFESSPVSLSGQIDALPGANNFALHVSSEKLVLDDRLRAAMPDEVEDVWATVSPGGPIRLDLTLDRRTPTTAPATQPALADTRYTAIIDAEDCTAQLAEFPLPLERVNGRFVLTPGAALLEHVSARNGETQFEIDGKLNLPKEGISGELALNIRAITFSQELRQALPARLRRLWYDAKPSGKASVFIRKLTFSRGPKGENWAVDGAAELDGLSLHIGSDLTDLTGKVTGSGGAGENVYVSVDMNLEQASVEGRVIRGAHARLSRQANDTHLRLQDLKSSFYDGSVIGELDIDYAEGRPTYGFSVSARGVSLEKFLNATRGPNEPQVKAKGTVEGTLGLAGRFGDPTGRRGGGTVFIRQAQMAKIPLVLSIFRLVTLNFDDNAFEDVQFGYVVNGEDLLLREIDLRGKGLAMVGAGRVHIPTEGLDLTLLLGGPLKLPRIEVLSDLLEGMAHELFEVHVEGTLDQPKIRGEAVKSVRKAIEAVFNARRERR